MEYLKKIYDFAKNNKLELNIDMKIDRLIFNFISKENKMSYHKMVYNADLELNEAETINDMLKEITARITKEK